MEQAIDEQEVRRFEERIRDALGDESSPEYVVEPHVLGPSVELLYEEGALSMASAGDDGNPVEEVTANVKTILAAPLKLRHPKEGQPPPPFLSVTGTVYMEKADFDRVNAERQDKGLSPFTDPGKAASDSLRQGDLRATAKRPLTLFTHWVREISNGEFQTHYDLVVTLQEWDLRVNRAHMKVCATMDEVIGFCRQLKETELPYETLGALITVNSREVQAHLQERAGAPGWRLAYRFRQPEGRGVNGIPTL